MILDGYSVTQEDLNWAELCECGCAIEVMAYERTAPAEVVARCTEAEAVLTNKVVINAEAMAELPRLRYIGVLATGYNVVDCEAARQRGIVVTNIPAYSTASVAQLVFAHLLNVTNSVAHYAELRDRWPSAPDFTWSDTALTELAGKTFGIYGLGNIGSAVARIAVAFGMKVKAVTSRAPEMLPTGVEASEWDDVLAESDVLSLHCPLSSRTRALINKVSLARMKPTAILINTARGAVTVEADVAEAVRSGKLSGAGIDVLDGEPMKPGCPLYKVPGITITPHVAWGPLTTRKRLIKIICDNIEAFLTGKPINRVN